MNEKILKFCLGAIIIIKWQFFKSQDLSLSMATDPKNILITFVDVRN